MSTRRPVETSAIPCLVPESEIKAFVGQLKNCETRAVMTRLLVTAVAAIELVDNRCAGKPDETKLMLIKELALEDKNKRYRHIMDRIIAVLSADIEDEEWMKGFGSACATIARAVEYASESLPDYLAVLNTYEQRVEQARRACGP